MHASELPLAPECQGCCWGVNIHKHPVGVCCAQYVAAVWCLLLPRMHALHVAGVWCVLLPRMHALQEQTHPPCHELLRQSHPITHIFILLEGSVELTMLTIAPRACPCDPDSLTQRVPDWLTRHGADALAAGDDMDDILAAANAAVEQLQREGMADSDLGAPVTCSAAYMHQSSVWESTARREGRHGEKVAPSEGDELMQRWFA
jgi:hypothetical protein